MRSVTVKTKLSKMTKVSLKLKSAAVASSLSAHHAKASFWSSVVSIQTCVEKTPTKSCACPLQPNLKHSVITQTILDTAALSKALPTRAKPFTSFMRLAI